MKLKIIVTSTVLVVLAVLLYILVINNWTDRGGNVFINSNSACMDKGGDCIHPVGGECPSINGESTTRLNEYDDSCREQDPTTICCTIV